MTMQVNLFFDWLSNGELLTLKTGPPCIPGHPFHFYIFVYRRLENLFSKHVSLA